jgi:RNAse (barnase) inhibitor barstar
MSPAPLENREVWFVKKYVLEAKKMMSQSEMQKYLKEVFEYDDDMDMDAFYSVLMSIKEPCTIELDDMESLVENLERYALSMIKLLREASNESEFINFEMS